MNFNINDFSGPLDLLLHMIKRHEMDVYEVDLKVVIDEYIDFINSMDNYDLDGKSEFLTMASELVHLKSKLLLGLDEDEKDSEYEINSEEDLRNRIIEFEKYQQVSNNLRLLEKNRQDYFTREAENISEYGFCEKKADLELDVNDLFNAMLDIQSRLNYLKPKSTKITKRELSINDKTQYIRSILKTHDKVEFFELFVSPSREEIVVTLLSILEMSKNKEIILSQKKNFSNIFVEAYHE